MLYDENYFPEPSVFRPERFLKDGKLLPDIPIDPEEMVTFGFGRRSVWVRPYATWICLDTLLNRICPGAHLVMPILHLSAASILSLFDILPELDNTGSPVKFVPQFTSESLLS